MLDGHVSLGVPYELKSVYHSLAHGHVFWPCG
ncbi:hypothetical protein F383_29721 [Gossypium arboreum]|uniref:Uncharacterized protein n=1 Tax=Gossypium arboreum TaxID=29729 RepID=A0A0B0P886_GOSAR|nr:hypothetical protein F383_29721 [Gossypium arboreum]